MNADEVNACWQITLFASFLKVVIFEEIEVSLKNKKAASLKKKLLLKTHKSFSKTVNPNQSGQNHP